MHLQLQWKDEEIFGGGFFDKIKKVLSVANNFLKSTGAISKLGKYIPHVEPAVSTIASSLGYGIPGYENVGKHSITLEEL